MREPFLSRLAFGRSPFQPSDPPAGPSLLPSFEPSDYPDGPPEYIQIHRTEQHLWASAPQTAHPSRYIQLYDERGSPINPRARELARAIRRAQNDVLSSIGVVHRGTPPPEQLPGTNIKLIEQIEAEEAAGYDSFLAFRIGMGFGTYWIGVLRDRILTFGTSWPASFADFVAFQCEQPGPGIIYAGLPSRLFAFCARKISSAVHGLRPLDRLLNLTRSARTLKRFLNRWRHTVNACFHVLIDVALYPFAYHASLQRLGLLSAKPLLPPWRSFLPSSLWSHLRLPPLREGFSLATVADFAKAASNSPLVFVCLERLAERIVIAAVREAIESTIFSPKNPVIRISDDGFNNTTNTIIGIRRPQSPPFLSNSIRRFLVSLGWGAPYESGQLSGRSIGSDVDEVVEVGGGLRLTNTTRLDLATVHAGAQPIPSGDEDPFTTQHDDEEGPRIHITSRTSRAEDGVEMAIRSWEQPVSFAAFNGHSGGDASTSGQNVAPAYPVPRVYRVTQLSTQLAQGIGAIFRGQLVGWAVMPLKLVTLRLVASHYLSTRAQQQSPLFFRALDPFADLRALSLRSAGLMLSRVALCGALEVAVSLGLWGCHWAVVTFVGKKFFSWGKL